MSSNAPTLEPGRLEALLGQAIVEFGATVNAALVVSGDRLALRWLNTQAASGYVEYDADTGSCAFSPEQAATLAP
jgi:hypothetical protein